MKLKTKQLILINNLISAFEKTRIFLAILIIFFLAILAFSINYRGGEYLHLESHRYILSYLDNRPLLQKIFDFRRNDQGFYQARELSYFFALLDAHFIKYSIKWGLPHFYSLTDFVGITLILFISYFICLKYLNLKSPLIFGLLGVLFLTAPSTFFSGVFLRPSKTLTAVFFTLIIYILLKKFTKTLRNKFKGIRASTGGREISDGIWRKNLIYALIPLSFFMSISDRQGYFFLLSLTLIFFMMSLFSYFFQKNRLKLYIQIASLFLVSTVLAFIYTYYLGPFLIYKFIGVRPDISYLKADINVWLDYNPQLKNAPFSQQILSLALTSSELFFSSIGYYLGNISLFLVIAIVLFAYFILFKGKKLIFIFSLLSFLLILIMYFIMIGKDPAITWPGIRFSYYTFPTNVMILILLSLVVGKIISYWPNAKMIVTSILLIFFILNLRALPGDFNLIKITNAPIDHEYAPRLLQCLKDKYTLINIYNLPPPVDRLCNTLRAISFSNFKLIDSPKPQ